DSDLQRALNSMREAAALESARLYSHFGPPSPTKPANELYGELLLRAGRPEEALDAFETSLWIFSRRPASVLGAARAANAAGKGDLATTYLEELQTILADADAEVRERYLGWDDAE